MPRAFLAARSKSVDISEPSDDEEEQYTYSDAPSDKLLMPSFDVLPPEGSDDNMETGHNTRAAKRRKQNKQLQQQQQQKQQQQQQELCHQQQQLILQQAQDFQEKIQAQTEEVEMLMNADDTMASDGDLYQTPAPIERWIQDEDGKQRHVYECSVCGKAFNAMYRLQRHLPTHTGERKYECLVCHKRFSQASTLYRHRAIHSTDRPFHCEVCNKAFNRQSTLIAHARIHSDDRPHKCSVCNKAFHQKGNLRTHMNTHLQIRPYQCKLCDRGFNQQSNLSFHIAQAHTDTNRVSCHLCGDQFRKKHDLRKHELKVHGVSNKTELEAWREKKASGALCEPGSTSNTITLPNGDKTIKFDAKRLGLTNQQMDSSNVTKADENVRSKQIRTGQRQMSGGGSTQAPSLLCVENEERALTSEVRADDGESALCRVSGPDAPTLRHILSTSSSHEMSQKNNQQHTQMTSVNLSQNQPQLPISAKRKTEDSVTSSRTNQTQAGLVTASKISNSKDEEPLIGRKIATFVRVQLQGGDSNKDVGDQYVLDSTQIQRLKSDKDGQMVAMIPQEGSGIPLLLKMLPLSKSLFKRSVTKDDHNKISSDLYKDKSAMEPKQINSLST